MNDSVTVPKYPPPKKHVGPACSFALNSDTTPKDFETPSFQEFVKLRPFLRRYTNLFIIIIIIIIIIILILIKKDGDNTTMEEKTQKSDELH